MVTNIETKEMEENFTREKLDQLFNSIKNEEPLTNNTTEIQKKLSPAIYEKYTFGRYLTETQKDTITNILSGWNSPITIKMISDSCRKASRVPVEYLLGFMQNDSRVGTMGLGAKTHNPGNVGNTGKGMKDRGSREKGVEACANNLQARIDSYLEEKVAHNGKGFNDFPTPEELATGKSRGGHTFFGIYMMDPSGPKKVAGMVKTWVNRLKS